MLHCPPILEQLFRVKISTMDSHNIIIRRKIRFRQYLFGNIITVAERKYNVFNSFFFPLCQ